MRFGFVFAVPCLGLGGCLWGDKGGYGIDTASQAGYVITAMPDELPTDGSVTFSVKAVEEDMTGAEFEDAVWSNPSMLDTERWTLPVDVEWKVVRLTYEVKNADGKQIGYGSDTLDLPFDWEELNCYVRLVHGTTDRWESSCYYDSCEGGVDPTDGVDCAGDLVDLGAF